MRSNDMDPDLARANEEAASAAGIDLNKYKDEDTESIGLGVRTVERDTSRVISLDAGRLSPKAINRARFANTAIEISDADGEGIAFVSRDVKRSESGYNDWSERV